MAGVNAMKEGIAALLILALFFVVGSMSYGDAIGESQHYRDMVCAQAWPPTGAYTLADCLEIGPAMSGRY